jgi:integrase
VPQRWSSFGSGRRCRRCSGSSFTWTFRVDVGGPGEPRKVITRGDPEWTEADARRALLGVQRSVADDTRVEASKLTVAKYLDGWLERSRSRLRQGSWAVTRSAIRVHIDPAVGPLKLQALTPSQIRQLYMDLEPRLAMKTIQNVHVVLRRALADAVLDGLLTRNPADGARRFKRTQPARSAVWTPEQTTAFLAHVRQDRLFAMWRLAATSGVRRGELLALTWADVDLDRGTVSVNKARVRGVGGWVTNEPKTPAGRRMLTPDDVTVAGLRELRKAQMTASEFAPTGGLVFVREDGLPLVPDDVTGSFERHAKAAGLPRIRLHDLRHGAASLMLASGTPAKVVQEQLGHSSITVTMDLYSHLMPGMKKEASERLARLIDGDA